ncbi:MAG: hypothetical protein MUC50_16980 [Myxococcota bacterium]|nr:hypothetical protein [Myxococcota bacterium]
MTCYQGTYRGTNALFLENGTLRLCVLPDLGAKIASILHRPSQFEALFQPPTGQYGFPSYGASFAAHDASGADDMFPTIDACRYPGQEHVGVECPDHGELWAVPWSVERMKDGEGLACRVSGRALPYVFERRITLPASGYLRLEYRIENTSEAPLLGFWAFHGLLACDERSRLELPRAKGAPRAQVRIVQPSGPLGLPGTVLDFPAHILPDDTAVDVGAIAPQSAATTKKFYVDGPVETGEAAMTLDQGRLRCALSWDAAIVPYLGVWITEGGFRGDYNAALEPATGFYDDLALAARNGLKPIAPRAALSFWLEMAFSPT